MFVLVTFSTYLVLSFLYLFDLNMTMIRVRVMTFNHTFNNISVISWRSVLFVEETGVLGESHRPVASHWQTLSDNVVSNTPRYERDLNSQPFLVIDTEYICSCRSNYHTITTTMVANDFDVDYLYIFHVIVHSDIQRKL